MTHSNGKVDSVDDDDLNISIPKKLGSVQNYVMRAYVTF